MPQRLFLTFVLIGMMSIPGHAAVYRVQATACNAMVQQHDGGGAAYQPGVDVRGNAVTPADVGASMDGRAEMQIPESVDIDIGIDLADRLGRRDQLAARALLPAQGAAKLGVLTIKGGDAFWNGEKIAPRDQAALAGLCRAAMGGGDQVLPIPKPALPQN